MEKHISIKKTLQMGKTLVCHDKPQSKIQPIEWKHTDSPVKKKFPGTAESKKGYADNLQEHERTRQY